MKITNKNFDKYIDRQPFFSDARTKWLSTDELIPKYTNRWCLSPAKQEELLTTYERVLKYIMRHPLSPDMQKKWLTTDERVIEYNELWPNTPIKQTTKYAPRKTKQDNSSNVKYTTRICLSCLKKFKSWGISNRICKKCRDFNKDIFVGDEIYIGPNRGRSCL